MSPNVATPPGHDVPPPTFGGAAAADASNLTSLGSATTYKYDGPSASILEVFPNPAPPAQGTGKEYEVVHRTKEFTSLCPKTGQPDFATIEIVMAPDKVCPESKSLKLYLGAYRNTGAFMERITNQIRDDLVTACDPVSVTVTAYFKPRGGIRTSVRAQYRRAKKDLDRITTRLLAGAAADLIGQGKLDLQPDLEQRAEAKINAGQ